MPGNAAACVNIVNLHVALKRQSYGNNEKKKLSGQKDPVFAQATYIVCCNPIRLQNGGHIMVMAI